MCIRDSAEHFVGEEAGHAVGKVESDFQVREIAEVLLHEFQVIGPDVHLVDGAAHIDDGRLAAGVDPFLDLSQSGVETDG